MSLMLFDPVGSLLRTSLLCVHAALTGFSSHWRESATPAGRSWWVLMTSGLHTDASVSSSSDCWSTPTASQFTSTSVANGKVMLLPRQAAEGWPTPMRRDGELSGLAADPDHWRVRRDAKALQGINLQYALTIATKDWPTAAARDVKGTYRTLVRSDGKLRGDLLPDAAGLWPTPRAMTGGPESALRKQELGRTESGGGDIQAAVSDWPPQLAAIPGSTPPCSVFVPGHHSRLDPMTTNAGRWCCAFALNLPQRRLNPWFVEWLMGFPCGWLDGTCVPNSELLEMLSFPPSDTSSPKPSVASNAT